MIDETTCKFYNSETNHCSEVDGVKKTLKWGVGIIITVFIAAFGYFAHNQSKVHDLMLSQTANVAELKAIVLYRVLPNILERKMENDTKSSLDRPGDDGYKPAESRHYPTGRVSGD
jgi:hypothetical protein